MKSPVELERLIGGAKPTAAALSSGSALARV